MAPRAADHRPRLARPAGIRPACAGEHRCVSVADHDINKDEVSRIMAVEAELLRTEGIDPKWPGFEVPADEPDNDRQ